MYLNLNLGCALIAVLMLLTPAQGVADTSEAVAVSVQRGDTLFSRSSSDKTTWRVIRQLRKALAKEAESFDLLWRLARAYGRLGEVARLKAGDDAAAGARGKDGLYYAAKAIKADPTRVEGHYWAAVCLGLCRSLTLNCGWPAPASIP